MSLPYPYMLSAEHLRSCFNAMNTPTSSSLSAPFSIESILGRVPLQTNYPSTNNMPTLPMDMINPWAYAMLPPGFLPNPLLNASLLPHFQLGMKRRRRHRTIFNEQQIQTLETAFSRTHYPDVALREKLAIECCLKEERVEVWFKNRRAKQRKQSKEVGGAEEKVGVVKGGVSDDSECDDVSEDEEPKEKRIKKESPVKE